MTGFTEVRQFLGKMGAWSVHKATEEYLGSLILSLETSEMVTCFIEHLIYMMNSNQSTSQKFGLLSLKHITRCLSSNF